MKKNFQTAAIKAGDSATSKLLQDMNSPTTPSDFTGLDLGIGTPGEHSDIRPIGGTAKVLAPEKKKKRKLKSLADLPPLDKNI